MKRNTLIIFILFAVLITSGFSYSQILNPSFENWNLGEPVDWATANVPTLITPVIQTSSAYDGSSAVQLEIKSYLGYPYAAYIQAQDTQTLLSGHPVSTRYSKMSGYFRLSLEGTAQFEITIIILDETGWSIGAADSILTNSSIGWIRIEVPIEYFEEKDPSSMFIQFSLYNRDENDSNAVGSKVIIDNLTTTEATSVENIEKNVLTYSLEQNYPNPFNPSTTIEYQIPSNRKREMSNVKLIVYDILGKEVATLVNEEKSAGVYSVQFYAKDLPSGVYIYKLDAGNFADIKKMIIIE